MVRNWMQHKSKQDTLFKGLSFASMLATASANCHVMMNAAHPLEMIHFVIITGMCTILELT